MTEVLADNDASIENNEILTTPEASEQTNKPIIVGANRTELYLPLLKGKRVGVVANQTSVIFKNETTNDRR